MGEISIAQGSAADIWPAGHRYGDTIIKDRARAILGNLYETTNITGGTQNHYYFQVDEVSLLRDVLSDLRSQEDDSQEATLPQTIIQLDALELILKYAIELKEQDNEGGHAGFHTITAIAHSTLITLHQFRTSLQPAECAASNRSCASGSQGSFRSTPDGGTVRQEITRLRHYLTIQLLCINSAFQLIQHQDSRRQSSLAAQNHHELTQASIEHSNVLSDLHRGLRPVIESSKENHEVLLQVARDAKSMTKSLYAMNSAISRSPAYSTSDTINLSDALDREFKLPFSYFEHWQTFIGFLEQKFDPRSTPGGLHVQNGDFSIFPAKRNGRALTRHSWSSSVYPGCKLIMSIILGNLEVSAQRCPREECGYIPAFAIQDGTFISCIRCGLVYRLDQSLELPFVPHEDEIVDKAQKATDLQRFGQRPIPVEVFETNWGYGSVELDESMKADREGDQGVVDIRAPGQYHVQDTGTETQPPPDASLAPVSQDLVEADLENWRMTSALPMTEPASIEHNEYEQQVQWKEREIRDLQLLKHVHFTSLASNTRPLIETYPLFDELPLEGQLYMRKISDKFPALPPHLAARFSSAGIARKNRLSGLRSHSQGDASPVLNRNDTQLNHIPSPNLKGGKRWKESVVKQSRSGANRYSTQLQRHGLACRIQDLPIERRTAINKILASANREFADRAKTPRTVGAIELAIESLAIASLLSLLEALEADARAQRRSLTVSMFEKASLKVRRRIYNEFFFGYRESSHTMRPNQGKTFFERYIDSLTKEELQQVDRILDGSDSEAIA